MALYISDVIALAEEQVGYIGKKTNSNLYDKTANVFGSYSKFSTEMSNVGMFASNVTGAYWCTSFIAWLFYTCTKSVAETRQRLSMPAKQAINYSSSCEQWVKYYKNAGRWSSTPQVGYQWFYKRKGAPVHTGIVVEIVDATSFYTIDGNTSGYGYDSGNVCAKKLRTISDTYGFGMPYYDGETPPPPVPTVFMTRTNRIAVPAYDNIEIPNVISLSLDADSTNITENFVSDNGWSAWVWQANNMLDNRPSDYYLVRKKFDDDTNTLSGYINIDISGYIE